jgi:hypothetical protein
MSIDEPVKITIELTSKEADDLLDVKIDHPTLMTRDAAGLIERINSEYHRCCEADACNEQWRKTDGE